MTTTTEVPPVSGESKTCGECVAVTGRCYLCRVWMCQHLLKRSAGRWWCVECWGRETA